VLANRGDRVAFHWRGEEGEERDLTYAELLNDVQQLASALKAQGIGKGEVVGIYLPMIPEVVVAMLACARIGAPHTVVFGSFAPAAVRERLEVSRAKALILADGARRKGKLLPVKQEVDKVISGLPDLETVVVVRAVGAGCDMRPGRDLWFDDLIVSADPVCPAEPVEAEHPLFLLYSSGSTAKPKGILHTTGGYLTGVTTTTAMVFDLYPERDVFWCTADVGWITGHSSRRPQRTNGSPPAWRTRATATSTASAGQPASTPSWAPGRMSWTRRSASSRTARSSCAATGSAPGACSSAPAPSKQGAKP